ncbi:MAG: hypothetical protein PHH59_13600 [Methylovulum sp.]|uniref:hypothetical protein n=1 Tax=Methylovulum sp. TaxID=1916980 RepID=UPI002626F857|nr:hypothetical protein [Methylovulum sp.]MDD2725041.1 hypothetical protein [Methylovulum sp.]MDD5124252.1 hypothetical protein [Methylovulum sp.]
MKRCVIHVGMHKTGTSSIQQTFWKQLDNPEWKYVDLMLPNHCGPMGTLLVDDSMHHQKNERDQERSVRRRDKVKNILLEQLDSNARNFLISAEVFCSSAIGVDELIILRDLLSSRVDKILAVGYVRPPKSLIESAFMERTKRSYFELNFNNERLYPDYRRQFSKFYKVFGKTNVLLWKFDPSTFTNGCVVQDFCTKLDINFPVELIKSSNIGLSREALAFLYTYHKYNAAYSTGSNSVRGKRGHRRKDLLMFNRLATLPGNKTRFSWDTAITPMLEERKADIAWIEKRLGVSMDEPHKDAGPVIASESDLLSYRPQDLQWLAEQLGSDYLKRWNPQMPPQVVADWMYALHNKLLDEDEKLVQNGDAKKTYELI